MTRKRALVVDDSRSARLILKRLLEQHGIAVDEAASAEAALDFLHYHKPNAIFMDHMMPGIDGLEAVRIIKSDPETALIPIMMYTSREGGELYLSQARALGAVGVLPKEMKSVDLPAMLRTLHLLDDDSPRPATAEPVSIDIDSKPYRPAELRPEPAPTMDFQAVNSAARAAADDAVLNTLRPQLERQTRALRQSLREELQRLDSNRPEPGPARSEPVRRWPALCFGLLLGVSGTFGAYQLIADSHGNTTPAAGNPGTNTTPAQEQGLWLSAMAEEKNRTAREQVALLRALEWGLNHNGQFDFGSIPFDNALLGRLNELLPLLHAGGFRGRIELTAHSGQFCLQQNAESSLQIAPEGLPLTECDGLNSEAERLQRSRELESLAFARFANQQPLLNGSPITLQLNPSRGDQPLAEYPPVNSMLTASDWNAIARQNQRVEIRLVR
ncbi:response regulator [Halopseudomonas salegens]|uniref:Response regulator receiver domain-containing protein n=1 Tax=Halopseudomonas salegens TaxID=1434072 RepID=A0A1H2GF87_9GAMM|nr:response regulator [Halopseudomonas salegens]SDU18333.1 Response regulator receiver domain-containing protein [Halopseudomonas salegens]